MIQRRTYPTDDRRISYYALRHKERGTKDSLLTHLFVLDIEAQLCVR